MKIDVSHVAKLANLSLSSEEAEKYSEQLSKILEYMEQLNQVDTSDVEATFSVSSLKSVMRKDETELGLTQEQALQNTKSKENGFFKIKAIFEER